MQQKQINGKGDVENKNGFWNGEKSKQDREG